MHIFINDWLSFVICLDQRDVVSKNVQSYLKKKYMGTFYFPQF